MKNYKIYGLLCLNRENPVGFEETPVFSWKLESSENNTFQTSYQIKVRKDSEMIWDSGEITSEETSGIVYKGKTLSSGSTYHWNVISKNNYNQRAVSEDAEFTTGILESDFWKAAWVECSEEKKPITDITDFGAIMSGQLQKEESPENKLDQAVYFRKEFQLSKPVKRAVAYATAYGIYDLQFDGVSVSHFLAPEYTTYRKHLEYQTYDVTRIMEQSENHAVGCILADGWYTGKIGLMGIGHQYGEQNAMLFQLEVEYEDGTKESICSDDTMKWSYGGYRYADLFVGEYLDTDAVLEGFSTVGYEESDWRPVVTKAYGYGNLKGQSVNPVVAVKEITPTLIRTPKGELVLDAGENICGFTSFDLETPVGIEIGLEHSEVLDAEGNFLQNIMGQNKNQKDRIITSKEKTKYRPKFTFHGFRYVKVTGLDSVDPKQFTITVIASQMNQTGTFVCSDEKLTRLQENIFRSQQGNMVCIPTDCPQRERAGWTGDMQVYASTAAFNMDVQAFLKRWLYDMQLEQLTDGQIPEVIPAIESLKYVTNSPDPEHISSAGWADAGVLVPYALYQAYGDEAYLADHYEMMKAWMGYVEKNAGADLCQWGQKFHFGDWLIPSIMAGTGNPILTALQTKEEMAMAFFAHTTEAMANIASILGEADDVTHYLDLNQRIRTAFSETYVSPDGMMRQQLQGLYVIALHENLMNETQKTGALQQLKKLIHEAGDCLDAGFLSIPFLLDTLWDYHEPELAYTLLFQEKAPSWLYALQYDATTLWENWAAILPDGTRTNSSYNHFAFGCVGDFIYRKIGGLQLEEAGYKKVKIAPDYSCGLSWAETCYDSIHGKIWIRWEKKDGKVELQVKIPPNVSGIVHQNGENMEIGNGYYKFIF